MSFTLDWKLILASIFSGKAIKSLSFEESKILLPGEISTRLPLHTEDRFDWRRR